MQNINVLPVAEKISPEKSGVMNILDWHSGGASDRRAAGGEKLIYGVGLR